MHACIHTYIHTYIHTLIRASAALFSRLKSLEDANLQLEQKNEELSQKAGLADEAQPGTSGEGNAAS